MYYYLEMIQDLVKQEYYLEKKEINNLVNYAKYLISNKNVLKNNDDNINIKSEIDINEEEEKENKDNIIFLILLILIDLTYIHFTEKKMKNELIFIINSIDLTKERIILINDELNQVITFLFQINNSKETNSDFKLNLNKLHQKNIPKIFSKLFSFIFILLKIINENI